MSEKTGRGSADRRLRQNRELPGGRRRPHRGHHLRLLPDRLARALQTRLRADHGALVGGLHHDLDPLPADRTAALAPHLRAAREGPADRPADAGRLDDPARPLALLRGGRPGAARADPERPARGQRNALLGLLLLGPLLRGQLLRPRLPRRRAALRPVRGADPLRILLPHDLRGDGRDRHPQRPVGGRDRDHRRPRPELDRRPLRLLRRRAKQTKVRPAPPDAKRRR